MPLTISTVVFGLLFPRFDLRFTFVPKHMSALKSLRKRCETVLTRFALWFVPRLSRTAVLRIARIGGAAAFLLPIRLKKVALANLDIAFGREKSPEEKKRILKESCRTFALVLLDIFWFSKDTHRRIEDHVTFDPQLDELFQKKAHVCITAHLGNWELLGHAVSVRGNPLSSVAAPLVNPAVDEYFSRMRQVSGQIIIKRDGAIRTMLRTLKEDGKVGLLLDQNTRPSEGGLFVDFFGLPAPMSDAPSSLALKTNADVLFGFCIPNRDGSYTVHTAPKIIPAETPGANKEDKVRALTEQIARATEEAIRAHPGAWLWMYKRWKFVPSDRDPAEYPFYAKA